MLQKNQKINWKYKTVKLTAPDGVELMGEIQYWAKDYKITILKPFESYLCGSHLQYAVPVIYTTDEEPRKGVHYINLYERANEVLLSAYQASKDVQC